MDQRPAQAALGLFLEHYPEFKSAWQSPEHLHNGAGEFTAHGVCAEFASFFAANAGAMDRPRAAGMLEQVERVVQSDPDGFGTLANALCTCFLENIAQTEVGRAVAPLMGPVSHRYFKEWDAGL
jgi:hypothetical protein